MSYAFGVISKDSLPNPRSQKLSPIYYRRCFLRGLNIQVNLAGLLSP